MNEKIEIKIKKSLLDFITKEFNPQGDSKTVSDIKLDLTDKLYKLFLEFLKDIHK